MGRASVLKLNEQGVRVVGIARRGNKLEELKADCLYPDKFYYETRDLSSDIEELPDFVKSLAEKYGKFSGYVHAAGVLNPCPLGVFDYADALKDFNTNLFSAVMLTKGISMKKCRQDKLNIVYISSITAKIGNPGALTYCMTKASLNALVTTLAQELGGQKVRVNSVMPGGVDTDMAKSYNSVVSYNYLEKVKNKNVFHEICKPEDVADVVMFLLSSRSYWIQGQNIIVDGGETLG